MSIFLHEARLLARKPLPPLSPKAPWDPTLTPLIDASTVPPLVQAGWHLWNDDLPRAHAIAQANEVPDGNYWHAILHRREGDFSNSLYWYARVGKHPVLARMAERYPGWSFESFVRWCEKETKPRSWLEAVQAAEMEELLRSVSAQAPPMR